MAAAGMEPGAGRPAALRRMQGGAGRSAGLRPRSGGRLAGSRSRGTMAALPRSGGRHPTGRGATNVAKGRRLAPGKNHPSLHPPVGSWAKNRPPLGGLAKNHPPVRVPRGGPMTNPTPWTPATNRLPVTWATGLAAAWPGPAAWPAGGYAGVSGLSVHDDVCEDPPVYASPSGEPNDPPDFQPPVIIRRSPPPVVVEQSALPIVLASSSDSEGPAPASPAPAGSDQPSPAPPSPAPPSARAAEPRPTQRQRKADGQVRCHRDAEGWHSFEHTGLRSGRSESNPGRVVAQYPGVEFTVVTESLGIAKD